MADEQQAQSKRRRGGIIGLLIMTVALLLGACGFLFWQYQKVNTAQQKTVAAQTARLVKQLSKVVSLPQESATLATVLDSTKLGDQQLAHEAHNGDQLLIYSKAHQVILYRPSTQKVVDMFHIEATQATPQTAQSQTKPAPNAKP